MLIFILIQRSEMHGAGRANAGESKMKHHVGTCVAVVY